ncbi:hypothetical protein AYI70_g11345 [Smittium culicis]|uniref:Uncharacterized protein n=1 Tax=Smittium culicis TaxID=133412 RepID=A0A1R1X2A0_9FUNG|nr:hypothetical protein AYI70_g11345 [Smittium culicis]
MRFLDIKPSINTDIEKEIHENIHIYSNIKTKKDDTPEIQNEPILSLNDNSAIINNVEFTKNDKFNSGYDNKLRKKRSLSSFFIDDNNVAINNRFVPRNRVDYENDERLYYPRETDAFVNENLLFNEHQKYKSNPELEHIKPLNSIFNISGSKHENTLNQNIKPSFQEISPYLINSTKDIKRLSTYNQFIQNEYIEYPSFIHNNTEESYHKNRISPNTNNFWRPRRMD